MVHYRKTAKTDIKKNNEVWKEIPLYYILKLKIYLISSIRQFINP